MSEKKVEEILEDVDNYEQAVNACLSFIHIYKYDKGEGNCLGDVLHWIGKEYLPGNVTPDMTLQLGLERGLVVELKGSLPKNIGLWKAEFDQIKDYDVELEGWETSNKKIKQQELVLIINQKFSRKIIDYINENKLKFDSFSKNFCIVEYSIMPGKKEAIFLRKEYGSIDDFKTVADKDLYHGIPVALEYLLSTGLSKIKFLDYKPPVVYTMSVLWDYVFSSIPTETDWREAKQESSKKLIEIMVNIPNLRDILFERFSDKYSKQNIETEWIKEALEYFVKLKLAKRTKNRVEYIIKFRKKIEGEKEGTNKCQLFAELLYKEGIQTNLEDFNPTSIGEPLAREVKH